MLALMLVPAGAAERASTKQLLQQAEAAANSGKLEEAESAACSASSQEPRNQEARTQCDKYRQSAQAQRDVDHHHVRKGAADFAMKKLDAAESEFQAIKSTSFATIKKEWLDKISLARAQAEKDLQNKEAERKQAEEVAKKKAAEADAAMQANLNKGISAYEKNDFAAARKILADVGGSYQAQAQSYVANIDQYNRAMSEGARYEKAGEYKPALTAYQKAVAIKANGPLNPKEKLANLQKLVGESEAAQKQQEPTKGGSEQEQVLRTAIEAYYKGDYALAEQQLAGYSGPAKLTALAQFYAGASKLSRYFVSTDESQKEQLWKSALADLQSAKHTAEFVPPTSFVSPRVMEVYANSVQ